MDETPEWVMQTRGTPNTNWVDNHTEFISEALDV